MHTHVINKRPDQLLYRGFICGVPHLFCGVEDYGKVQATVIYYLAMHIVSLLYVRTLSKSWRKLRHLLVLPFIRSSLLHRCELYKVVPYIQVHIPFHDQLQH